MRIASVRNDRSTEVVLKSIKLSDLDMLPVIDDVPQAILYISPHFKQKLRTLKEAGAYFEMLRDGDEGWYWGIFSDERLCGITGYNELDHEDGPESFSAILDPQLHGNGIGGAAALARTYHALAIEGFNRVRSSVDVRNESSFRSVRKLGYVCLEHMSTYDYPRHELVLYGPGVVMSDADMSRTPDHGDSWQAAQNLTEIALERAKKSITHLD